MNNLIKWMAVGLVVAMIAYTLVLLYHIDTPIGARVDDNPAKPIPNYTLGSVVHFGKKTPGSDDYLQTGWSAPEESLVWTDGNVAKVKFTSTCTGCSAPKVCLLTLDAGLYTAGGKHPVSAALSVNGVHLPSWKPNQHLQTLVLSNVIRLNQITTLQFLIRNPASPKSFGKSEDARRLGVALHAFRLSCPQQ